MSKESFKTPLVHQWFFCGEDGVPVSEPRLSQPGADLALDRAFHYGHGLFETILVVKGKAPLLQAHLDRLKLGCERLSFSQPATFVSALTDYIAKIDADGVLKLMVTAGIGQRGYAQPVTDSPGIYTLLYPLSDDLKKNWRQDVVPQISAQLCATRLAISPQLAGIKHLNRLEWVLAANELDLSKVEEGLLFDSQDCLIEATHANVFLVDKNGQLCTPCINRAGVAGVMRRFLLDHQPEHDVSIQIQKITRQDLQTAKEIFVTSSVSGIRALALLRAEGSDQIPLIEYPSSGPVSQALYTFVRKRLGFSNMDA